jgi:glycogen debranching enzyme
MYMQSDHSTPIEPPADLAPYIFPNEHIIKIEYFPETPADRLPSGLRELYRLARAKIDNQLYDFDPPLASLALEAEQSQSPDVHRYEALFGRDSLRVAMDLISLFPQLTSETLVKLAENQGVEINDSREEEPGRIPHEIRSEDDPFAHELTAEYGWGWPYYGSIDATPQFIRTFFAYSNRNPDFPRQHFTGRDGVEHTMLDAFESATNWLLKRVHNNPEGLLESKAAIPGGIKNQVWKDSWDAYFHKDGQIANHDQGVASIEVQRLAYDTLLDAAQFYDQRLNQPEKATVAHEAAATLKKSIFDHFWTDEQGGYFVLGTDRDETGKLRQLRVRASNMGHLLYSRLLANNDPRTTTMREAIVRQLFSPEMLTPSGIRTLASDEVRFRPGAYHNGSVWLWDTYYITKGLRKQKYFHLADLLSERLFNVINTTRTFPEFVRGDNSPIPTLNNRIVEVWDETYQQVNKIEQPPQQVQAWSVAAILALKHYNRKSYGQPKHPPTDFENEILAQVAAREANLRP